MTATPEAVWRSTVLVAWMVAYGLTFALLQPSVGLAAAWPYLLLVARAGWLLGVRGGLLVGLLAFPLHALLLNLLGQA